jgi:acyl-CoA synthetase (AMP-forming)/AMP-acid ligase II
MTRLDHLGYLTDDATALYPKRPAMLQEDTVISYAELDEHADRIAGWLVARGVSPGDRVGLMWNNDYRYVEQFLGSMRAGAVAVPMNIRQSDEGLAYVLADCGAVGLLAAPLLLERAEHLAGLSGAAQGFLSGPDEPLRAERLEARVPHHPDEICMQPYTSGSTGRPKGVPLTHRGQIWNSDTYSRCYLFDETDRAPLAAPLYHKNAGVEMKAILRVGGSCVILDDFEPVGFLKAIERYKVTFLTGVPAMFRRLLNELELLSHADMSSVRFAVAGSAPVTVDLLEDFKRVFGVEIIEGYGLTEGGPNVLCMPRWGTGRIGSLGLPLPGCEVQLRDSSGEREVERGEVGELWVRNPGITPGYHGLPEVTAERIRDGWLATRDLMRRDEDGYFYFVGRTDDLIIVSGENVYPKEVEQILLRHESVRDVAVVAGAHPEKGAVPVAFVVADARRPVSAEELTAFYHLSGPHFAYPRVIEFVDALPLSGTGKIDRNALALRAQVPPVDGRTQPAGAPAAL